MASTSTRSAKKNNKKPAVKMAAKPAPHKSQKATTKPSKLSTIKDVLFGKKKAAAKAPAPKAATKAAPQKNGKAATKAAPKAAKAPVKAPVKPAAAAPAPKGKAAAKAAPAPAKKVEVAPPKGAKGKAAAAPAPAKTAPAPAAVPAKAAKGKGRLAVGGAKIEVEAVCREVACEGLSTTAGYCRLHYIKNWKKIQRKQLILKEGKLNQYIEELVLKYPDKYIEAIRQDLANDKDFAKVIYDLDLDESVDDFDVEGENLDSVIDTIKREFDDEGEAF